MKILSTVSQRDCKIQKTDSIKKVRTSKQNTHRTKTI